MQAPVDPTFRWDLWHLKIKDEGGERQRIVDAVNAAHTDQADFVLDPDKPLYVIGYLNSPRSYYDGADGTRKHHLVSGVGTALTQDFEHIHRITDKAFHHPGEGSTWTGSFIRGARITDAETGKERQQYVFFYTHRKPQGEDSPDGMTQEIKMATTEDFIQFTPVPDFVLNPDPRYQDMHSIAGDTTIHAFRDPAIFRMQEVGLKDRAFMLVTAQSTGDKSTHPSSDQPALEQGLRTDSDQVVQGGQQARPGNNGVLSVFQSKQNSLTEWEGTSLQFATGLPEAEVSSIYQDKHTKDYIITFTACRKEDYLHRTGPTINGNPTDKGRFMEFRLGEKQFVEMLKNPPSTPVHVTPKEIPLEREAYASRFIETMRGMTVGFDPETGGPCIASREPHAELKRLQRSFKDFDWIQGVVQDTGIPDDRRGDRLRANGRDR